MKHNPMATANALAVMTVIIFVVCRILVGFFPDLFFTIAQSWFHGITLTPGGTWNLSLLSFTLYSILDFARSLAS